jgi:hypothetical protein
MLGGIAGDVAASVFLRGGVRGRSRDDSDAVIIGGVEIQFPGFCAVCGSTGGDR